MIEFEEEFNNCLHFGFIPNEPQNKIIEHFKDWQPPKPLVVVPQCVADWFEENKHDLEFIVWQYINHWDNQEENEFKTFMDFNSNKPIQTIFKMLDGYTVKEEKKYILKHIDMSKLYTDVSLYLAHGFCKELDHVFYKDVNVHNADECHFTQSEIDKLNIGSYEKIEVEP